MNAGSDHLPKAEETVSRAYIRLRKDRVKGFLAGFGNLCLVVGCLWFMDRKLSRNDGTSGCGLGLSGVVSVLFLQDTRCIFILCLLSWK